MKNVITFYLFVTIIVICISAPYNLYAQEILRTVNYTTATITHSPLLLDGLNKVFDSDPETFIVTKDSNPFIISFDFDAPRAVDSIALYFGHKNFPTGKYVWWVEAADTKQDLESKKGTYLMVVPKCSERDGGWDCSRISSTALHKIWQINIQCTNGGNMVFVGEVGLYEKVSIKELNIKYNLGVEVRANNVVGNVSGGQQLTNLCDDLTATSCTMENTDNDNVLMTFHKPASFSMVRIMFGDACEWRLESADTYADLNSGKQTYEISANRQAEPDKWDTLVFSTPMTKKHMRFVMKDPDNKVIVKEIEFVQTGQGELLYGIQQKMELWVGWRWRNTPEYLIYLGSEKIPANKVKWSSSNENIATVDTNGFIKALHSGTAYITATYENASCTTEVTVKAPVLKPLVEKPNGFIGTPAEKCINELPVLIIQYIPTTDGLNRSGAYAPNYIEATDIPISSAVAMNVEGIERMKFALEQGSRFRAYKNPDSRPFIGVKVVDFITIYEPLPPGILNGSYNDGALQYSIDYDQMFERINLKDYVENKGVRQVWMWGASTLASMGSYNPDIHKPETAFRAAFESYMSTPTQYMACNGGNPEPLPIYNKTYTVITQSAIYPSFTSNNFEPFTHQFEHLLLMQNRLQDGSEDFFWNKFVGKTGRCGWTHTPPNTEINYGYFLWIQADTNQVKPTWCDIEDWKPDNSGEKKLISYHAWTDMPLDWPTAGLSDFEGRSEMQWFIYWLQSIPGYENKIPYEYQGKHYRMTNWWKFFLDWDENVKSGNTGLWEEITGIKDETNKKTSTLTVNPNPSDGVFRVTLNSPLDKDEYISVVDVSGREIFKSYLITGSITVDIDISAYTPGVYLLKKSNGAENTFIKLIKK